MKLFGWTLTRMSPPPEIVDSGASCELKTAPAVLERLNRLETVVEQLQIDHADRQLTVLNSVERVLYQLGARERKRERKAQTEEPVDEEQLAVAMGPPIHPPARNRFRRF